LVAIDLISQDISPLQTSDTGDDALAMMQLYHVHHLPIVNHEQLLGVISEEDILIQDSKEPIGSYRLNHLRPFCLDVDHLFEIMTKIGRYKLSLIPVIDREEKYLGIITMQSLVQYFATHFSFASPGSIIILESTKGNYSLAEIARIAESEDIVILSSFINGLPDSNRMLITLKLNRQDISGLKATYERFGYQISATFSELEHFDGLKERYDSLISYLNI
jgi:CBS domain-containing protein